MMQEYSGNQNFEKLCLNGTLSNYMNLFKYAKCSQRLKD